MSGNRSRDEVLSRIRSGGGRGDRKIHRAFAESTDRVPRRLTRQEAKVIAWKAADGRGRVTDREAQCLREILRYELITDHAERYLRRYLRMSIINRDSRRIFPMSNLEEARNIQTIYAASQIGVEFTLPDKLYFRYSFSVFQLLGQLLTLGDLTQFKYRGRSHGVYFPRRDCLMVDYFESRPAHEVNATIVHEAVHAMQDVYNNDADVGHLESAAHLAQAVWLLRQGRSLYGRLAREPIADVANAISQRADSQGYVRALVTDSEYQGIRETLRPPYRISDNITMSGDIL